MSVFTPDPTFGLAIRPTDYDSLGSGWGLDTVFSEGFTTGPTSSIGRMIDQDRARNGRYQPPPGVVMGRGPLPPAVPDSPLLDPDEANKKYGIPGELDWKAPVREGEAKLLNQWKVEKIQREDVLSRATPGFIPGAARLLTGVGATMVDPLNVAAAFIPIAGEARWAALAGKIGLNATRVARGGVEGLAGTAAVEPITYLQARNEQSPMSPYDVASDLLQGAVGGAGLHLLGGFWADAAGAYRRWNASPIELRDAAAQQGVAALVTGTPVRADQIVSAADSAERVSTAAIKVGDQVFTGPTHSDAYESALTAGVPEDAASNLQGYGFQTSHGRFVSREDALTIAQGSGQKYRQLGDSVTAEGTTAPTAAEARASVEPPKDAMTFLMSKGGLRDTEGHDLAGMIGQRANPRYGSLLRKSGGMSIDDAGEALHEAGYFGDPGQTPRPTEAEVLDYLRDASATKRYQVGVDAGGAVDKVQARDMADNALSHEIEGQGVTVTDNERSAALDAMTESGMSPSDALDHVLERSSIEGGTFTNTAQRLGDVEDRIEGARARGASLVDLAPLMDERAALKAELTDQRMSDVGRQVAEDLRGAPGSMAAVADAASRQASEVAQEALPASEAFGRAKEAADSAEVHYRAVLGELLPEDRAAIEEQSAKFAAKRQGAIDLAGCMIREGI